ncbi:hypothetical protein, partial [uncultured Agrobacterium sp.]|uniref:hypothetical protein n=1 Tax=uncultured Agrobacterium sp. TaxID=157277 RepID=UPI00258B05E3
NPPATVILGLVPRIYQRQQNQSVADPRDKPEDDGGGLCDALRLPRQISFSHSDVKIAEKHPK